MLPLKSKKKKGFLSVITLGSKRDPESTDIYIYICQFLREKLTSLIAGKYVIMADRFLRKIRCRNQKSKKIKKKSLCMNKKINKQK